MLNTPEPDVAKELLRQEPILLETQRRDNFVQDLAQLINRYSLENMSNTPDYILASYLYNSLVDYAHAVNARDRHAGIDTRPRYVPIMNHRT